MDRLRLAEKVLDQSGHRFAPSRAQNKVRSVVGAREGLLICQVRKPEGQYAHGPKMVVSSEINCKNTAALLLKLKF